jgi:hypothetical protein
MVGKAVDTKIASAASGVDLAGDAAPDEPIVGAGNNFADELVARDSSISHVTADQFEIGATNAGKTYAHETFARRRLRIGTVVAQGDFAVEVEGTHQTGTAAAAARASTLKQNTEGNKNAASPAIHSVDLAAVLLSELDLTVELDFAVEDSDLAVDSDLEVSDDLDISDFVDESEVLDEPLEPPLPAVESVEDSVFEPEWA